MTPEEMLRILSRHNRTSLTAEQMRAMPKEQVIKHALELQGKLDRALSRAYNFGSPAGFVQWPFFEVNTMPTRWRGRPNCTEAAGEPHWGQL